jgi:hypothetical protein
MRRIKRWWRDQQAFIKEFSTFCTVAVLLILAVFGPMVLAGGVFIRPWWLLTYIPIIAIGLEINQNY